MRPAALALPVALAALLAFPAGPAAPAPEPLRSAPDGPLVRLVDRAKGGDQLVLVDPATLKPVSPRVRTFVDGAWPAFSPDRRVFAYGDGRSPRVQLFDVAGWRSLGVVELDASGPLQIVWPEQARMLVLAGAGTRRQQVAVVDTATWQTVSRRTFRGDQVVSLATRRGLAVLTSPAGRVGTARLMLADVDGRVRSVRLRRIRAGYDQDIPRDRTPRSFHPGLAIDRDGDRAYVVAAKAALVAEVDLGSGRVAYHRLAGAAERAVAAKASGSSYWRDAAWLGDGRLAVTGEHSPPSRPGRRLPPPIEPFGVRLIDVASWRLSTLNRRAMQMYVAGNRLLASGTTWDASGKNSRSTGLLAFDARGRRAFRRFRGADVVVLGAHGRLAYVWVRPTRMLHVVDLSTGATRHRKLVLPSRLPFLFAPLA